MNALQLVRGEDEEFAGDLGITAGQRCERPAVDHQHLVVGNRFGGTGVLAGELQTEHVSRQIKAH